jgi:hypothetical protein
MGDWITELASTMDTSVTEAMTRFASVGGAEYNLLLRYLLVF